MQFAGLIAPIIGAVLVAWISTFVRSDAKKSAQSAKDYSDALQARTSLVDALRDEVAELKSQRAEDQATIAKLRETINECLENQARQATIQRALQQELETLKAGSKTES